MSRMVIRSEDRLHMLVWRVHPSAPDAPGWRTARAVNGCPIEFAARHATWVEALDAAIEEAS